MKSRTTGLAAIAALACPAIADYPRAGWKADLCTMAHNVSGTVTIVDEDTVKVDNFTYDGGGMDIYFVLGAEDADDAYKVGLPIGNDLFGTVFDGESFEINLPPGKTLDDYNAISVWCVKAEANFGSGPFLETMCYADFNSDGKLDLFDFLMFVEDFNAQEPRSDCDADNDHDLFDFLCFLNAFNQGCP